VAKQHLNRFISKGFKADKATEKAMASGKRSDHTAAMRAHTEAAKAANQAGVDKSHALHHQSQASVHSAHIENIKTEAKAKALTQSSGTASSRARAASKGAFGTDPTTGNAQSKAKVGGVRSPSAPQPSRNYTASQSDPKASGPRGTVNRLPKGMIPQGTATAHEARYNNAARSASNASAHAEKANTAVAHSIASQEHAKAAHVAREQGQLGAAKLHENMSTNHALLAREGGRANLNHGVQTGGGANNATRVSVHPAMRGEASTKYNSATLRKQLASQPRNIPHPTAKGVTTKGAMSGMSTEAAGPHTDASAHAFAQGTKANAKPSLASHSMAAKAHLQAATHYGTNDSRHAQHLQQAEVHRTHATTHSQRIMKLKKLGPGQKHGAGGRFTGVPGGAK
jgi:hypothetical protein